MNTDGSAVNSAEQPLVSINSKSDTDSDVAINYEPDSDDSDNETISADGRSPDLGIKDPKQPFLSVYPKTAFGRKTRCVNSVHPGFLEESG